MSEWCSTHRTVSRGQSTSENFGEGHFFAVGVEGGGTVLLEFAELLQYSGSDQAFHLREPDGVIGMVYPAVVSLEFEGLSMIDLDGDEGITAEALFFDLALRLTGFFSIWNLAESAAETNVGLYKAVDSERDKIENSSETIKVSY